MNRLSMSVTCYLDNIIKQSFVPYLPDGYCNHGEVTDEQTDRQTDTGEFRFLDPILNSVGNSIFWIYKFHDTISHLSRKNPKRKFSSGCSYISLIGLLADPLLSASSNFTACSSDV